MSNELNHRSQCWKYPAEVVSVKDGDTLVLNIDMGRGQWWHRAIIRLLDIDCPERKTAKGKAAADYVRTLLPEGASVFVQTHSEDHFGRWLAQVWLPDSEESLSQHLLSMGFASYWSKSPRNGSETAAKK